LQITVRFRIFSVCPSNMNKTSRLTSLTDYYPFGSAMEGRAFDPQTVADENTTD